MDTYKSPIIFGEVLFDHFPDGSRVLGGAPFNVAWHLQAFEQAPHFISRVGQDSSGHDIIALMQSWGMSHHVQIDQQHPTGSVQVTLHDGEPSYDIQANCAYDYIDVKLLPDDLNADVLYHGSLALRNPDSYNSLQSIKTKHQGKVFMDVNLRAPFWDRELLMLDLHEADWVKLNHEELFTLMPKYSNISAAMRVFYQQFNLETLVVTLGDQGAMAYDQHHQFISVKPAANVVVTDSVGAGDAFTAILLMGMQKNWSLPLSLERAQAFASAIVAKRGATVADRRFYQDFITQWR